MGEWEACIGDSSEWYTPPAIFDALGLTFDLDPCLPGAELWVPAWHVYTIEDDGLSKEWCGLVFMNPPFGGRNGQVPWLRKFVEHRNGIAIVAARTSAGWIHEYVPQVDTLLFPRSKTKFIRPDGSVGGSPGTGIVMLGMGNVASDALRKSGLGLWLPNLVSQEGRER